MKRVFGFVEAIFDSLYLLTTVILGIVLLSNSRDFLPRILAGIMALVLVGGDAFHLIPRIRVILTKEEERFRRALGQGKKITSITMTIFYLVLWHIGLLIFSIDTFNVWTIVIYSLALVRIILCFFPQNKWESRFPPVKWGIYRNIPFFAQGLIVAILFFNNKNMIEGFYFMWLAIVLSFAFYLPVVIWANKNPKIGMLMLLKTSVYVWILIMCLLL